MSIIAVRCSRESLASTFEQAATYYVCAHGIQAHSRLLGPDEKFISPTKSDDSRPRSDKAAALGSHYIETRRSELIHHVLHCV